MFGVRFAPLLTRACKLPSLSLSALPKMQFSLINKQTTCLLDRTSMLPCNIMVKNLIEMLQKLKEQSEQQNDKDIKNLSLLNQGTVRMSHTKICDPLHIQS